MPDDRGATGLRWDERSGRYRDAGSGRYRSRQQVREALDAAVERAGARIQTLAQQLQARTLSVAEWQTQTRLAMRDVHAYSAAVAQGGLQQMTPREWGYIGAELRAQYRRLGALAAGLTDGSVPADGKFLQRMRLYGLAGRATYEDAAGRDLAARGFDEERSVRRASDSCRTDVRAGCVECEGRGWQPAGTLPRPGRRTCLGNCLCFLLRRNSRTGQIAA